MQAYFQFKLRGSKVISMEVQVHLKNYNETCLWSPNHCQFIQKPKGCIYFECDNKCWKDDNEYGLDKVVPNKIM